MSFDFVRFGPVVTLKRTGAYGSVPTIRLTGPYWVCVAASRRLFEGWPMSSARDWCGEWRRSSRTPRARQTASARSNSPPGSPCKRGGWQTLCVPLSAWGRARQPTTCRKYVDAPDASGKFGEGFGARDRVQTYVRPVGAADMSAAGPYGSERTGSCPMESALGTFPTPGL